MNTQTHTQTEAVILEMLTENTGRNMLDSGGAYGRNWERNQALGGELLADSPAVTFGYGSPEISVFHYLKQHLTYAPDFDAFWQRFDDERPNTSWGENLDEWLDTLGVPTEANDLFYSECRYQINTYNLEYCLLGQTLQYVMFGVAGADFVALQIHGGCDVRGGYTKPRIFRLDTSRDEFVLNSQFASVTCSACSVSYDFSPNDVEAFTDHADGDTAKIEALTDREIAEHFWSYDTQNVCPNCSGVDTITGGAF